MAVRTAHGSHRWSTTSNTCKGCGCAVNAPAAAQPCPTPYKPPPRGPKEYREP